MLGQLGLELVGRNFVAGIFVVLANPEFLLPEISSKSLKLTPLTELSHF